MLSRGCILRREIQGLDPDKLEHGQLSEWMKAHPRKKELSEEKRAQLCETMRKIRGMEKMVVDV